MEQVGIYIMTFIETGGLLAPLLFIIFHLIRPLFFMPVVFICISGGILFGAFAGTFYSLIGITLSSIIFYFIVHWMPKSLDKFRSLKNKLIGSHAQLSTSQISILRLVPFIHFHLLSLCLMEGTENFKDYAKSSVVSNIPIAFVYTSIGQWVANLSPLYILVFLTTLLPLLYVLRRKEVVIKWQDFFQVST